MSHSASMNEGENDRRRSCIFIYTGNGSGAGERGVEEKRRRMVGKYELKRTIGEGMFAKVKLGVEVESNAAVAVKIVDKKMVIENNLMYQVH